MPYVGVRHVLRAAGLLRHQERISSELGVETINDLVELKQQDLAVLGLGEAWPKFAQELAAVTQRVGGSDKFGSRRRVATEAILAHGSNATGALPLSLFLAAAGATLYADRLDALGVRSPTDLRVLRRADLTEMGMQVLHQRRFLSAARLAPPLDDAAVAASARSAGPATDSTLCTALFTPLGMSEQCAPGNALGRTPLSRLCTLHTVDLERAGMRLVPRRRLRTCARVLCPAPASATPATKIADAAGADTLPPADGQSSRVLDGCRHVFLDVGLRYEDRSSHERAASADCDATLAPCTVGRRERGYQPPVPVSLEGAVPPVPPRLDAAALRPPLCAPAGCMVAHVHAASHA